MKYHVSLSVYKHFSENKLGRDFFVGDIHGKLAIFSRALDILEFHEDRDRLFSVGDLIDRGEASYQCFLLARQYWFNPVMGNHELFLLNSDEEDERACWYMNGGDWWEALTTYEKVRAKESLLKYYYLTLSVDTPMGKVGVVHSQYPLLAWPMSDADVNQENIFKLLWARDVIQHGNSVEIEGIDYLISGHTPVSHPFLNGQQLFIDTGSGHIPFGDISEPCLTLCELHKALISFHHFSETFYKQSQIQIK